MTGSNHFTDNQFTLKEVIQNLGEWLAFFVSKWKTILLTSVVGLLLGCLVSILKKPIFHAETSFVLEDGDGRGAGQMSGLASAVGINLGALGSTNGLFQGENILELYRSDRMLGEALLSPFNENELLIDRYIVAQKLDKKWASKVDFKLLDFSIPREEFSVTQDSVVMEVSKLIRENQLEITKPDRNLSIILVRISSKDQLFAKILNEKMVEKVNNFYLETKTKKTGENQSILQNRADSVRTILDRSLSALANESDRMPYPNPILSSATIESRKLQINVETNISIYNEIVKNLEIAKINHQNNTPLIQIIDYPRLPLKRSEIQLVKGMVLGAIIAGMLALFFLYISRLYEKHIQ